MLSHSKIFEIIRESLELPEDFVLADEERPAFIPGWDSLGWVKIIIAIEESADIEIPLDTLDDVVTIGEFCDALIDLSKN